MESSLEIPVAKRDNELPALSNHTFLRYFNFIALYLAQGIPEGMLYFGFPAWMAVNGKSPAEIGAFVAIITTPWTFKFLIGPMMDRFTYLPMGRRRPWVLTGQFGLMTCFILMSLVPDPLNNLNLFMLAGFCVSFFGALQDVATDGLAIDIVPVEQQARANGLMWGSKTVGISGSLAIGTYLLNSHGYHFAILCLAMAVSCIMLVPLLLKERPGEKLLPWLKGLSSPFNDKIQAHSWGSIMKSLWKVISLKNSTIFFLPLFLSATGFGLMNTLLPIFTIQKLGWTNADYSQINATASLIGGISGMMICGILIDKFGKVKMLSIYLSILVLLPVIMVLMESMWANSVFITGFIGFYNLMYVFSTIGIFAVAMKLCWKKVSATQFTLFMATSNLGLIAGPALIGYLRNHFSWNITFLCFSLIMSVTFVIIQFLRTDQQLIHIETIEANEMVINDNK